MAIPSNASFIPMMNEFLGHWNNVNRVLPTLLVLSVNDEGMGRDGFLSLRGALVGVEQDIQDKLNDIMIARADIALKKRQLLAELNLFTGLMDSYYLGTKFFAARPNAPSVSDGREAFTKRLYDVMSLWAKLDGAVARPGLALPIVLSDGTAQAAFAAKIAALEEAYIEAALADQDLRLARAERSRIQRVAYATMKVYRKAVPTICAQHPALVATLPRLSPRALGQTQAVASAVTLLHREGGGEDFVDGDSGGFGDFAAALELGGTLEDSPVAEAEFYGDFAVGRRDLAELAVELEAHYFLYAEAEGGGVAEDDVGHRLDGGFIAEDGEHDAGAALFHLDGGEPYVERACG